MHLYHEARSLLDEETREHHGLLHARWASFCRTGRGDFLKQLAHLFILSSVSFVFVMFRRSEKDVVISVDIVPALVLWQLSLVYPFARKRNSIGVC